MRLLSALVDLAAAHRCAGCGASGARLCGACLTRLVTRRGELSGRVCPDPAPEGMPPTWAAAGYDEEVRQVISQHKDGGRTDLRGLLAALWRDAAALAVQEDPWLRGALRAGEQILVVPAPSSVRAYRARGRDPWAEVVQKAVAKDPQLTMWRGLQARRRVADQAGLGARERWRNLDGALGLRSPLPRNGAVCLLSDDVLTTGATLTESARALRAAGARHVAAAVLAATARHGPRNA